MPSINEVIQQLPPELQEQVREYAVFLLQKNQTRKMKKINLISIGLGLFVS